MNRKKTSVHMKAVFFFFLNSWTDRKETDSRIQIGLSQKIETKVKESSKGWRDCHYKIYQKGHPREVIKVIYSITPSRNHERPSFKNV